VRPAPFDPFQLDLRQRTDHLVKLEADRQTMVEHPHPLGRLVLVVPRAGRPQDPRRVEARNIGSERGRQPEIRLLGLYRNDRLPS